MLAKTTPTQGGANGEKDTLAEGLTTKDQVAILSRENIK